MTTDFRALCAELLRELEHATHDDYQQELKDRARAALAEPQPEPPTDEELMEVFWGHNNGMEELWAGDWLAAARTVLARWNNS